MTHLTDFGGVGDVLSLFFLHIVYMRYLPLFCSVCPLSDVIKERNYKTNLSGRLVNTAVTTLVVLGHSPLTVSG